MFNILSDPHDCCRMEKSFDLWDAKMGTGRMSLEKAFKGITVGQRDEIKVFRLCQFI